MLPAWIAPVAKTFLTVAQVATTVGIGMTPAAPLAPLVAGVFALGGIALDAGLKQAGEDEAKSHEQYVRESMEYALDSLDDMNGTLYDMKDSLTGINGTLIGMNGSLHEMNITMIRMKGSLELVVNSLHELNESLIDIKQFLEQNAQETRETLRNIQSTLKTFEENMNRNFDELKNFMIEKDFIEKIQLPLKSLWDLMQAASESQTEDSIERFLKTYRSHSARSILAEFINRLEYSHTNPISSAMENNVLNSRKIMDHYIHLLSHMAFKVLAIEGFYFGVADTPKNSYLTYMDRLSKDVDNAISTFRKFLVSYKIPSEKYWPVTINTTIIQDKDENDLEKRADKIKYALDGIYTTDVFTIYLIDCKWKKLCAPLPLMDYENYTHNAVVEKMSRFMIIQPSFNGDSINRTVEMDRFHEKRGNVNDSVIYKTPEVIAMVLRSEKFHEMNSLSFSILQSSFRGFAHMMKRDGRKSCNPSTPFLRNSLYFNDYGHDPFLELSTEMFKPNLVSGFVVCNVDGPIVARFTNNGSSILTDDDNSIVEAYYALNWI